VVHHAARAQALAAGTTALLAALALAACGGGGAGSGDHTPRVGGADIGVPVKLVDCADWKRATPTERTNTVISIRGFAGGATGSPGGHGAVLDDEKAYQLFENTCRQDYARAFKLYKLYTRAAAFTPQK
jgi:hypothetical protein